MNKLGKIEIPEGIFYLGNYPQLLKTLPSSGRYVFNKVMTGCGAMQIFAAMQKYGIDPEKATDKEMEEFMKKAIANGDIHVSEP